MMNGSMKSDSDGLYKAFAMQDRLQSDYARALGRVRNRELRFDIKNIISDENEILSRIVGDIETRNGVDLIFAAKEDVQRAEDALR